MAVLDNGSKLQRLDAARKLITPEMRRELETALHNSNVLIQWATEMETKHIPHGTDIEELKAQRDKIQAMLSL
jgi:hypothetical protein